MIGELHHLFFRWLHVLAAMLGIGRLWSAVFRQRHPPARPDLFMRIASAMVSNHFPLVYGDSRRGLVALIVVLVGCLAGMSLEWMASRRYATL